jgi:Cu2+-exporting ATPase
MLFTAVAPLSLFDDPQEWSAFSQSVRQQSHVWQSSVVFEGMHCAACAINIEDALKAVPGVGAVQVSAASHRGLVEWTDAQTRPSEWMAAAEKAGYKVVPANDALANEQRRSDARQLLWRWSVAGLCMMQVMMYATPAYLSKPGDITPEMVQLLRWASWVLSLPVMFFSCRPFFASAWRDVSQRRVSMDLPVAIGIAVTFIVSSLGTFEPAGPFGGEVYFDSLTMFVFFLLTGRWLELRLRNRTAGALEAVMNRLPSSVNRKTTNGLWERIAIRRLVVGDVLLILPGEAIAADGKVIDGLSQVDEALLTGESRPLSRGLGSDVIAGSHNLSAPIQVRVTQVGAATRFAHIVALMESASVSKPEIAMVADRWAKPFLGFVLMASLGAAIYWWPQSPAHALMVAVAVLIVTCPCALSLATPAAMLASAGALARGGVLVRKLQGLQALASVDTVVFDKTGTLTQDAFALAAVQTREGLSPAQALFWAGALARHSLHPVSRAISSASRQEASKTDQLAAWELLQVSQMQEIAGEGVEGLMSPVTQPNLRVPTGKLRLGSGRFCGVNLTASLALRAVLADETGWLATFELQEEIRSDARETVQAFINQGLHVMLLSGDGDAAVQKVASMVGITDARGGCSPQDKLAALQGLQAQGHQVAMVGDGLNDGPILAGANVSFALGQAVPLAQSKADFVLLGAQLGVLVSVWARSRLTLRVVHQNLAWAAIYNAACVPLAILGWLPAWLAGLGMAFSSLCVVFNALRLSTELNDYLKV